MPVPTRVTEAVWLPLCVGVRESALVSVTLCVCVLTMVSDTLTLWLGVTLPDLVAICVPVSVTVMSVVWLVS